MSFSKLLDNMALCIFHHKGTKNPKKSEGRKNLCVLCAFVVYKHYAEEMVIIRQCRGFGRLQPLVRISPERLVLSIGNQGRLIVKFR